MPQVRVFHRVPTWVPLTGTLPEDQIGPLSHMLWILLALPGPFVEKVLHALSPTLVSVGSKTFVKICISQQPDGTMAPIEHLSVAQG